MIRGGWTPAAAYAFMVFVLLYTPCLATIAAIQKETSPTIASFSVGYSLVLAWIVAFVAYRIGIACRSRIKPIDPFFRIPRARK